ncbi:MAG: hypothetical protein R3223_12385, partial [Longimicrobiales bacterium]|nr:hypothetical protein [Longimicrobiales bacterium]
RDARLEETERRIRRALAELSGAPLVEEEPGRNGVPGDPLAGMRGSSRIQGTSPDEDRDG